MPGHLDSNNLNFTILDLVRLFRHAFERGVTLAGIGVTPAEARVLTVLYRHGPMRQHALAERLGVAQMSICSFVDGLEAAGLVKRQPDMEDRRAKQVHLTEAAEPILAAIAKIDISLGQDARGDMTDAEWSAFVSGVTRARDNMMRARDAKFRPVTKQDVEFVK